MAVATASRTDRLLEAACRVVARRGAHALRMADVAREASVSSALLHYYFETRTELLARAFAYAEERAYARIDAVLDDRTDERRAAPALSPPLRRRGVGLPRGLGALERGLVERALRRGASAGDRGVVCRLGGPRHRRSSRRRTRTGRSQRASMSTRGGRRRLAALVDGLGSQRLLGLVSPAQATALVEDALELELGLTVVRGRPRLISPRATMSRWISLVPSQIRSTRSSRKWRSAGYSVM